MNKRIFVALDLPASMKADLLELSRGLRGARWLVDDQIHLTLRFIGEVDGVLFQEIKDVLKSLYFNSFELKIKGVGHFPPRGEPKVLWAGIEPNDELISLKRRIDESLKNSSITGENRKFHPHVTLARLNKVLVPEVADWLQDHALLELNSFRVGEFLLISSNRSSSGAIYQPEGLYSAR
ncbi:RNA 2',3'-cyclic phosphodiesterase [bacterium]|jgi:RNA 2',3'-cyclic 3'-phosphodiesterase|nr:RNA 2',3'-cyclic phosphodiesterase [bacterium]